MPIGVTLFHQMALKRNVKWKNKNVKRERFEVTDWETWNGMSTGRILYYLSTNNMKYISRAKVTHA